MVPSTLARVYMVTYNIVAGDRSYSGWDEVIVTGHAVDEYDAGCKYDIGLAICHIDSYVPDCIPLSRKAAAAARDVFLEKLASCDCVPPFDCIDFFDEESLRRLFRYNVDAVVEEFEHVFRERNEALIEKGLNKMKCTTIRDDTIDKGDEVYVRREILCGYTKKYKRGKPIEMVNYTLFIRGVFFGLPGPRELEKALKRLRFKRFGLF